MINFCVFVGWCIRISSSGDSDCQSWKEKTRKVDSPNPAAPIVVSCQWIFYVLWALYNLLFPMHGSKSSVDPNSVHHHHMYVKPKTHVMILIMKIETHSCVGVVCRELNKYI